MMSGSLRNRALESTPRRFSFSPSKQGRACAILIRILQGWDPTEEDMNTNTEKNTSEEQDDRVALDGVDTKFAVARKILAQVRDQLQQLERLLSDDADDVDVEALLTKKGESDEVFEGIQSRVVEGVFDGQNMIGSDGQKYSVPPNYASKSKLVEGDILKLTVRGNGAFLFKQIGPIERDRRMGTLVRDEMTQEWYAVADGKKYKVLSASVSFFRGEEGDEVAILLPRSAPSKWAAVENVIKG